MYRRLESRVSTSSSTSKKAAASALHSKCTPAPTSCWWGGRNWSVLLASAIGLAPPRTATLQYSVPLCHYEVCHQPPSSLGSAGLLRVVPPAHQAARQFTYSTRCYEVHLRTKAFSSPNQGHFVGALGARGLFAPWHSDRGVLCSNRQRSTALLRPPYATSRATVFCVIW